MKKIKVVCIALGIALVALGVFAIAVDYGTGTQNDPLVTLSYINDVFKPSLLAEVDKASSDVENAINTYEGRVDIKLDEYTDRMSAELSDEDLAAIAAKVPVSSKQNAPFTTITLTSGESLTLKEGCEILTRSDLKLTSGVLIDISAGSEEGSQVKANHLYTAVSTANVTASKKVTVYIRGDYVAY